MPGVIMHARTAESLKFRPISHADRGTHMQSRRSVFNVKRPHLAMMALAQMIRRMYFVCTSALRACAAMPTFPFGPRC